MENLPETLDLYFDGVKRTCTLTPNPKNQRNEPLYVADNGRFVTFPAEYAEGDSFEQAVERHNDSNSTPVEIVEDVTYGEVTTHDKDGNVIS